MSVFKLSITKDEFDYIKNKNFRFMKRNKNFETKCIIKMFEPFFKKNEEFIEFAKIDTPEDTCFNFNILREIPEYIGDEVKIKSDENGDYFYTSETFSGKIRLPLRNWTFKLKKISNDVTFCYFRMNGKGEYIVMKKFITG